MLDTHQLKPIFKIDAQELLKQFEANESEATSRYTDKTISVGGIVSYTNVTDSSASIFLNDAGSVGSIICVFQKNSYSECKKLKTGDSATIKGICSGYLMDVIMCMATTFEVRAVVQTFATSSAVIVMEPP